MRLAAEEFRTQRLRRLHQSSRSRASAEEEQCREQEKELKVLIQAAQKGFNWTSLEPQLALALACAARDTLLAEEETAKLKVTECRSLLATLKDAVDDCHARVQDAHHQITSIMALFDQKGIPINFHSLHSNSEPLQDHPLSDDIETDSDIDYNSSSDQESAPPEEEDF